MAGDPDPHAVDRTGTDPASDDPDARRRQRLVIWIGAGVLILALALVPVLLGGDDGVGEPAAGPTDAGTETEPTAPTSPAPGTPEAETPAPTPAEAPTPDPTPTPDATAEPPPPPPTPDPMTAVALDGAASVTGPTGDVVDAGGEPASAVDLVEVQLTGDGEELTVEWTVAGTVPDTADSLLWSVDLWTGEELAATITVQMIGARLVAGVLDWTTNEQVAPPDDPLVDGATVTLTVPLGLLPPLDAPVTWEALGQQDGGLEDRIPEDGRASFDG